MINIFRNKVFIATAVLVVVAVLIAALFVFSKKEIKEEQVAKPDKWEIQAQEEENRIKAENLQDLLAADNGAYQQVRPIEKDDHYQGKLDAPIQIIIYSSFDCPFTPQFNKTIEQVKQEFGDKVVVAFRHFILRGDNSAMPAALAVECAAEQGKFWEVRDKLYADNEARIMGAERFKIDAAEIGLDADKFNKCADEEKYADKINNQILESENFGVIGTPTSFINGEQTDGAVPFDNFVHSDGRAGEGMRNIITRHLSD
ncbi:MAG: thioredoxin domain-containing protein [bacterium]|nr:thioredoxin domain-containing protein [bacterium]